MEQLPVALLEQPAAEMARAEVHLRINGLL